MIAQCRDCAEYLLTEADPFMLVPTEQGAARLCCDCAYTWLRERATRKLEEALEES